MLSFIFVLAVYPKKYAHVICFAVLCCGYTLTDFPISIRLTSLALWQSNGCPSASKATLMNMDKYFMWIHYERLHNNNKAKHSKTVCIFLGILCTFMTVMTNRHWNHPWVSSYPDFTGSGGCSLCAPIWVVLKLIYVQRIDDVYPLIEHVEFVWEANGCLTRNTLRHRCPTAPWDHCLMFLLTVCVRQLFMSMLCDQMQAHSIKRIPVIGTPKIMSVNALNVKYSVLSVIVQRWHRFVFVGVKPQVINISEIHHCQCQNVRVWNYSKQIMYSTSVDYVNTHTHTVSCFVPRVTQIWVTFGSANALLPDGIKPLPITWTNIDLSQQK